MTSQAAKLVLALMLVAINSNSHAADQRPSLLQCGINIGGTVLTYQTPVETKSRNNKRMYPVQGSNLAAAPQFTTATETETESATTQGSDNRLPPKLTLAIIGCSWR